MIVYVWKSHAKNTNCHTIYAKLIMIRALDCSDSQSETEKTNRNQFDIWIEKTQSFPIYN